MNRLNWKAFAIIILGLAIYGVVMSFSQDIQIRWIRYVVAGIGGAIFGSILILAQLMSRHKD